MSIALQELHLRSEWGLAYFLASPFRRRAAAIVVVAVVVVVVSQISVSRTIRENMFHAARRQSVDALRE